MSEASAAEGPADYARELEEMAGELYGLPPDGFAAARDERVRAARVAGRQPLARELARLRRPTQSAWLINLLWREQREVVQQLLDLGGELSRAQAEASGPELHRLTALRRELETALIRTARGLAHAAGVSVSTSTEREAQETLSAALARPEVADEVRTGRLVRPATYAGFGTMLTPVVATDAPAPPRPSAEARAPSRAGEVDDREARAAQRARDRREQAERGVQEARAGLEAASAALAQAATAADSAQNQHAALRDQVGQLQQQLLELQDRLRDVQQQAAAAGHAALAATQHKDQAQAAQQTALRLLNHAQAALDQTQE